MNALKKMSDYSKETIIEKEEFLLSLITNNSKGTYIL